MLNDSEKEFERKYNLQLIAMLGHGKDGRVWESDRHTALKFFYDFDVYTRELRAYRILRSVRRDDFLGHQVPRLLNNDDSLHAIEMTIVAPPFLLDFAAAYMEKEVERFAFHPDVIAERENHWAEIFEAHWPEVMAIREAFFLQTGLILLDLSLNNVRFE
jgi:hypothetical protein